MTDSSSSALAGKTVLITGGTAGIGKATAIGLARGGAAVAIVGRDPARAEAAVAEIRTTTGNSSVAAYVADMSLQAEVRRLARQVLSRYPRLDVLVNNVGGYWATRRTTADGVEYTFAVNHLAAFLLTNLLRERLTDSAPARVVTVSSWAQRLGRIDFGDLQSQRRYSGQRAYNQSKLANVMFTYELARRLDGTGITANVLHPGTVPVRTNFGLEDATRSMRLLSGVVRPLLKTPERGAQTAIFLASSPAVQGISGQYFAGRKPKRSARRSYDADDAAHLWAVSEQLTGLDASAEQADAGTEDAR